MAIYLCTDDRRRQAVREQVALNGIDYVEVVDQEASPASMRQRILRVSFVNDPAPAGIDVANVEVVGGERVRDIAVQAVVYDGDVVEVTVDRPGDFSEYTLRLVQKAGHAPLAGLDPMLAEIDFSFKVECETDFDCVSAATCAPPAGPAPEINYLAKDYESFRQLMLDRLSLVSPSWTERAPADLGMTLVELLAYVGDRLSYRQDAIATEAYLGTARQRISVRRHARLVDYVVHEGCNARAWVCFRVSGNVSLAPRTELLTSVVDGAVTLAPGSFALERAREQRPESFETMNSGAVTLRPAHNELPLHRWGGVDCCLDRGATRATLRGAYPDLRKGDVLVFEETRGRITGAPADADPARRHAVRLSTDPQVTTDPLGGAFLDPPVPGPIDVTEIAWSDEDALPFALRVSETVSDPKTGNLTRVECAIARGNVVLVDHGRTTVETFTVPLEGDGAEEPRVVGAPAPLPPPRRFRPQLTESPLSHAAPFDATASAHAAFAWAIDTVLPHIALTSAPPESLDWLVVPDLIGSDEAARHFVVETDNRGVAILRFGDDDYGKRPDPGTVFDAVYRVGNGARGNVGAAAIRHAVSGDSGIVEVSNRLPAQGGVDPEALEHVRKIAPFAFRTQERAVTPDDYAARLEQRADVLRAAATFRWTGSWYTVFDTVETRGDEPVDAAYQSELSAYLESYRVVGRDLEIDIPRFVALDIAATVCVKRDYFRADVLGALRAVFSSRPGGLFDPARFAFGQTVYLSPLVAAAQSIEGVDSIEFTQFEPRGISTRSGLSTGSIPMGRLEIARVANDPTYPERGRVDFTMLGGK